MAIVEPQLDVTCVDSRRQEGGLHAAGGRWSCGLQNLRAEHARVETLAAGRFDVITSRAFASLADFVS